MSQRNFYYHHLDKVSRSFSFCIKELSQPHQSWVAIAYLLCRIADSIEDSHWQNKAQQHQALMILLSFIEHMPAAEKYQKWLHSLPQMPRHEQQLLEQGMILFADFHSLNEVVKEKISTCVTHMISGMDYFCLIQNEANQFRINSSEQLNLYCYFVAGTVGELLCHLYAIIDDSWTLNQTIIMQARHFGLFLQKTNMLKDQLEDEAQLRFYIPCRQTLLHDLAQHSIYSLRYIQSIPIISGRHYRLFCAWSLFLGLASYPWIENSFKQQKTDKIPAKVTKDILFSVKECIDDNTALSELYKRYRPNAWGEKPAIDSNLALLPEQNKINTILHKTTKLNWCNDLMETMMYLDFANPADLTIP